MSEAYSPVCYSPDHRASKGAAEGTEGDRPTEWFCISAFTQCNRVLPTFPFEHKEDTSTCVEGSGWLLLLYRSNTLTTLSSAGGSILRASRFCWVSHKSNVHPGASGLNLEPSACARNTCKSSFRMFLRPGRTEAPILKSRQLTCHNSVPQCVKSEVPLLPPLVSPESARGSARGALP